MIYPFRYHVNKNLTILVKFYGCFGAHFCGRGEKTCFAMWQGQKKCACHRFAVVWMLCSVAGAKKLALPCGSDKKSALATDLQLFRHSLLWQGRKNTPCHVAATKKCACHRFAACLSAFLSQSEGPATSQSECTTLTPPASAY